MRACEREGVYLCVRVSVRVCMCACVHGEKEDRGSSDAGS